MGRSRATRLGRAGLLLPTLLVVACASVPDLGVGPLTLAQLESRSFTLDVQLIRALGGSFDAA